MEGETRGSEGSLNSEIQMTGSENYMEGFRIHGTNQQDVSSDSQEIISSAQQQAQNYLNQHKIYELFNYLIGHLLVDEPDDPHEYLSDLLTKCQLFRLGLDEPPLLFTKHHIESIYQSFDPSGVGNISLEQYKTGMKTLGIIENDHKPVECATGRVDRQIFLTEAKKCLVKALGDLVGKPK